MLNNKDKDQFEKKEEIDNIQESKNNRYPKERGNFYFTKVFIHGILSDFHVKELKGGKKNVRLYINVMQNRNVPSEIPAEIEVCVERRRLLERMKDFLDIGSAVLIEGRVCLAFIKNSEKITKKIQYISAEEITTQKRN